MTNYLRDSRDALVECQELASLDSVRALEGAGPVRGRRLGRTVGLLLILAALIAGTTVALAGRSLPVLSSLGRVGGGGEAGHPPNGPVAISSPKGTIAAVPRTTSGDTLAAAQAIVAPAVAPQRLLVPAIGVNAPVESLGLDAKGRMATPSRPENVGWYSPGVTPGDVGNAVIDGHLDWTSGPAVFWKLGRVRQGDELTIVRADGSQARFAVQATSVMPYDGPTDALFTRSGPPSLTLITCYGAWDRQRGTYQQRLVVRASLVTPVASPADGGGG
jgi:LPXTG-site transpeptidase (sortase) family protein